MDKILQLTLLYDFYGELLTKKQREIFTMYFMDDFSMIEIGEQYNISRQAVNDLLKRTEKLLLDYENKLGLVSRFLNIGRRLDEIASFVEGSNDGISGKTSAELLKKIDGLREILV